MNAPRNWIIVNQQYFHKVARTPSMALCVRRRRSVPTPSRPLKSSRQNPVVIRSILSSNISRCLFGPSIHWCDLLPTEPEPSKSGRCLYISRSRMPRQDIEWKSQGDLGNDLCDLIVREYTQLSGLANLFLPFPEFPRGYSIGEYSATPLEIAWRPVQTASLARCVAGGARSRVAPVFH